MPARNSRRPAMAIYDDAITRLGGDPNAAS
jgi:hypothetical protein